MANRNSFGRRLEGSITSDDILGKNVIDSQGGLAGVAEKLFIDPVTLNVLGIEVDKGILHKGLSIGKGYIKKVTPHAIFLNTTIVYEMKGMQVFDINGAHLGKVKSVELYGWRNVIKGIHVGSRLKGTLFVPKEAIATVGENVLLNVPKSELVKSKKIVKEEKADAD